MLFLVRHGQVPQISPRRFLGQRDVPLDPTGIRQAEQVARAFERIPLSSIYCSDLERTIQTAKHIAEVKGLVPKPTSLLREIHLGKWENLTVAEVKTMFPGEYERRGQSIDTYKTLDGESFEQVQKRGMQFLSVLLSNNVKELTKSNVLAVAHGGIIRTLLCAILQKPLSGLFEIPQDYCGTSVVAYRDSRWIVESVNISYQNLASKISTFL